MLVCSRYFRCLFLLPHFPLCRPPLCTSFTEETRRIELRNVYERIVERRDILQSRVVETQERLRTLQVCLMERRRFF